MTNFAERIFVCSGFGAGGPELQLVSADRRTAVTERKRNQLIFMGEKGPRARGPGGNQVNNRFLPEKVKVLKKQHFKIDLFLFCWFFSTR